MKTYIKKTFPFLWDRLASLKTWWDFEMLKRRRKFHIMNSLETLEYIKKNHCSIARFGDGELALMMIDQWTLGFQDYSKELSEALRDVYRDNNEKLLVCIPLYFDCVKGLKKEARCFWMNWIVDHKEELGRLAEEGRREVYGNASITRPYIDFISGKTAKILYPIMKSLWQGKDILIVEGEQTRMGVGNDLFAEAHSVKRILAPGKNAFSCRQQILDSVLHFWTGEIVLIALGPTATVLASDLSKAGIMAWDVGHIDIEYEWFLGNAKQKTAIVGKYVNEVKVGKELSPMHDQDYFCQILARIDSVRQLEHQ